MVYQLLLEVLAYSAFRLFHLRLSHLRLSHLCLSHLCLSHRFRELVTLR